MTCHSSWASMTTAVARRRNAAGLGKISTTSARRLISLLSRSMGLFDDGRGENRCAGVHRVPEGALAEDLVAKTSRVPSMDTPVATTNA